MRLLLLGCSGFIGSELVPRLIEARHKITLVTRDSAALKNRFKWSEEIKILEANPAHPSVWNRAKLQEAIQNSEGIINLAGEPIANKRWSKDQCSEIRNSRIETTKALISAINQMKSPPKVVINASAIGFYGTHKSKIFSEDSPSGEDFLSNVCKNWESEAKNITNKTRLVIFRIGIVLEKDGGALDKMIPIFKAGLGGPIGNGKQWMSWIHRTDLCEMIQESITNHSWKGCINAVTPEPTSMSNFSRELGLALKRPSLIQLPAPILKLILGDGALLILEGQNVAPKKIRNLGFKFKYSNLSSALSKITNGQK